MPNRSIHAIRHVNCNDACCPANSRDQRVSWFNQRLECVSFSLAPQVSFDIDADVVAQCSASAIGLCPRTQRKNHQRWRLCASGAVCAMCVSAEQGGRWVTAFGGGHSHCTRARRAVHAWHHLHVGRLLDRIVRHDGGVDAGRHRADGGLVVLRGASGVVLRANASRARGSELVAVGASEVVATRRMGKSTGSCVCSGRSTTV